MTQLARPGRHAAVLLLMLGSVPFAGSTAAQHSPAAARVAGQVAGEVLVQFKPEVANARRAAARSRHRAQLLRHFRGLNIERLRLPDGVDVRAAARALRLDADILDAQPNYVRHIANTAAPNDPYWVNGNLWGMQKIAAPSAWSALGAGSSSTVVAVIDTGVNYSHPDLTANMWNNPGEIQGNGLDDDRNGYVDDVYGIDTINNDSNPMDDHGHGTHVAGTIGAVANNSTGVVGVAGNVRILGCKFLNASGSGTDADAIECLNYVVQQKQRGVNIRVTNNSWGAPRRADVSTMLQTAIDAAGDAGVLNVVAAGNAGTDNDVAPFDPASLPSPSVVSVAASNQNDDRASFSNFGKTSVDLAAPGVDILSTAGGGYGWSSGTSMAAPHVAGAAALLWSHTPTATVADIKAALLGSADRLDSWTGLVTTSARLNVFHALLDLNSAGTANPSSASFVRADATTQGSWRAAYGADGYAIAGDVTRLPAYAQMMVTGASSWTWAAASPDSRALERETSGRIAATWYAATQFEIDVNLTDGTPHQVALYMLDWDGGSTRAERFEVVDATTGAVLDSRNLSAFSGGQYLVWTVKGHVRIRVIRTGAINAVVSAVLFGPAGALTPPPSPPSPPLGSAAFVRADATTKGTWQGAYGADGYAIAGDVTRLPAYAQMTMTGATAWTWTAGTDDSRALQRETSGRLAATWYAAAQFTIDVKLTDGLPHQVALYALDWDGGGSRAERFDLVDAVTGAVLDSRAVSGFSGGHYLVWTVTGHVKIHVVRTGGSNGVVSAVFFGPAGAAAPPPSTPAPAPPSAAFVRADTTTRGSWQGAYGGDGYAIVGDATQLPAYAQLTPTAAAAWTWAATTGDSRALQRETSGRVAATWYAPVQFALDVKLSDGTPHQVAVYLLDWDGALRAARVDVLDAATGAVLDSRAVSGSSSGQYLVWTVTGHVRIHIARTAGPNAVVSGVFFAPAGG